MNVFSPLLSLNGREYRIRYVLSGTWPHHLAIELDGPEVKRFTYTGNVLGSNLGALLVADILISEMKIFTYTGKVPGSNLRPTTAVLTETAQTG